MQDVMRRKNRHRAKDAEGYRLPEYLRHVLDRPYPRSHHVLLAVEFRVLLSVPLELPRLLDLRHHVVVALDDFLRLDCSLSRRYSGNHEAADAYECKDLRGMRPKH